jgi:fatty-acyl-CoA synthase
VIVKEGFILQPEEVVFFCDGKLARYKWPKHVTFSIDFPRTSLGKVRKGMLKRP